MVKSAKESLISSKFNVLTTKTLSEAEVEKLVRNHMHRQVRKLKKERHTLTPLVELFKEKVEDTVLDTALEAAKGPADAILGLSEDLGSQLFNLENLRTLKETVTSCAATVNDQSKALDCFKSIAGLVSIFDPTGLAGIAAAFMYN